MLCETGTSIAAISATQCPIASVGTVNALVSLLVEGILAAQCNISRPDYWPPDYADEALQQGLDTYDFVVIGAGSAGSVVASRLSENPEWKVLVLEAGDDPPQESEIPLFSSDLLNSNAAYNYRVEANGHSCKAFENNECRWSRGNCLGGTGSINGMVYVRGNREDHDRWCTEGNNGWCYADLWPYYEKSVTPQGNDSHPMGYVVLNQVEPEDDIVSLISKGWDELQQRHFEKFGDMNYVDYGYPNVTFENGHRESTGKSYLGKVSQRKNLKVIKNAVAKKIHFDAEGKRAKSVEFVVRQRKSMKVNIAREAVVSTGALESPKLLMLSGIGPKEVLQPLNISILQDLPTGQNLQDHIVINMYLRMPAAETNQSISPLDSIYQYLINNKGPLSTFPTGQLTGYLKVNRTSASHYPDMHTYLVNLGKGNTVALELMGNTTGMKNEFKDYLKKEIAYNDLLIVYVLLAQPKSRGTIKLKSNNYLHPPIINSGYLEKPQDLEMLMLGIEYTQELVETSSFKEKQIEIIHIPIKECDNFPFKSAQYWQCYISYFTMTGYHFAGTVKMGPAEDFRTCVNPELKVKGIDNLRVADASIMPYVTSHNTNAPTIMIAEKAANMIKEQWMD